ncbi:MAG: hypothetical protein JWP87_2957 [Labilithrix sp.]|nr:hypothetical protein [Labilithrix sp.]
MVAWALWLPLCASARADGIRIRVRGSAKIVAHATRDQGELILSGSLVDDAGQPIPAESVTIHVTRESDPRDAKVIEGLRAARTCDRSTDRPPTAYGVRVVGPTDAPDIVAITDEGGRFCFRAKLVPDRHLTHLSWRGSNLVDGADADLAFDLSRQSLVLRFDPTPRIVPLDTPKLTFEAAALVEDDGTTQVKPGLALVLANEKNEELGRGTTDSSGRTRFAVDAARMGPPGRGALRVSFAGDAQTAFAVHVAEIERRVKVTVRVPAAERGELKADVPEDGIALAVDVASAMGPVSEGGVEARIGDVVVGAAPVERGIARLTLTFTAQGNEALVHLRYVPSAPWYEPLGEPTVKVPIRGPGLAAKAPILLAGLAVIAFFLVGRVASKSNKPEPEPAKIDVEAKVGKPRLDVVRPAAHGEVGWRGRVVDAHEATPVGGARVWVDRGTFEGRSVLASVSTDAHGVFELPDIQGIVGDEQMSVEAPLHARLVQPLPPAGELSIALVLRRRALLVRLVGWARKRGKPFDVKPEPTPGHVRRAAADDFQTARWADAVERAVFGGDAVDARVEREIERMIPPDPRTAGHPTAAAPEAPEGGGKAEEDERR